VLERSKTLAKRRRRLAPGQQRHASGGRGAEVLYARSWGCTKYWDDAEREAMVKRSLQSWRVDEP
jgi:hypothetical protein